MENNLLKIKFKLEEVLSPQKGYFGRIYTWGQKQNTWEYVGYELSIDFYETLRDMTQGQLKNLIKIINYFNIHAAPLKRLIFIEEEENSVDRFACDITWQQFMTVVMFGILEVAVKETKYALKDKNGFLRKEASIICFLEQNLSSTIKNAITQRYRTEKIFGHKEKFDSFSEVVDHLWINVRSGFVHEAGIESRGFEWAYLEGLGTKEDPMIIKKDVPMQELLQVAWQAILNSYGYKGELRLPKYK